MLWRDLIHLVLRSITSSPLRSALTALGIAIGIAELAQELRLEDGAGVVFKAAHDGRVEGCRIFANAERRQDSVDLAQFGDTLSA